MTSGSPRIGIIADTTLQGHLLSSAVRGQGYEIVVNSDPGNIEIRWLTSADLDLWVVDLNHEDRWQEFLDRCWRERRYRFCFPMVRRQPAIHRFIRAGKDACSARCWITLAAPRWMSNWSL
jgi:hypothetical protein